MEKITDFFKDVRERLSNPLFSSFIISWLIINWQVPIALLFYNSQTLRIDGFNSYIDLISKKYSFWNFVLWPLLFALLYTFAFPFFRNIILAFQTWIKTRSGTWNLKIAKEGKVSMERYFQLREKYFSQLKEAERVFSEEGSYVEENRELQVEKTKLTTQNNKLSVDLQYWQTMNDSRILEGEWDYTFKPSETDTTRHYRLYIAGGQVYFYVDASKREKIEEYNISDFFCNPTNSRMCFVLRSMSNGIKIFHNLYFPNGISELTGTENHTGVVVYKKVRG